MNTQNLIPEVVDEMELIIDWDMNHQMGFVYETPTENVEALLPEGIYAFEARPGISLIFLGYNHYNPGNIIYGEPQDTFFEITRFILVQPDLSVDMPMPRFAFYVLQIGSNNKAFIDQEIEKLHLPSYYSPSLVVETDEPKLNAWAKDNDGAIQNYLNTHPKPYFRPDFFWGQYFVVENNKLYFGIWNWEGVLCLHQRKGDGGGGHLHPFMKDLQPEYFGNSYMQLITDKNHNLRQRFYQPRFLYNL
ncbi:MAG: hypothetical protein MI974_26645 [Chitinophagales bacterium]|nr:hypothetical protein [Chitinophagales bacterium]